MGLSGRISQENSSSETDSGVMTEPAFQERKDVPAIGRESSQKSANIIITWDQIPFDQTSDDTVSISAVSMGIWSSQSVWASLFGGDKPDIDCIYSSIFPDHWSNPIRSAAGLCLCRPNQNGYSYEVFGRNRPIYLDLRATHFPRNCLCLQGRVVDVTFLCVQSTDHLEHYRLFVPRGIRALVNADWRPGMSAEDADVEIPEGLTLLCALAFEGGSRARFFAPWSLARCDQLRSIFLPASVEVVGRYSFQSCRAL
jgi:hypothetical protein